MTELCEALACKYHGKAFFDRLERTEKHGAFFHFKEVIQ